MLEIPRLFSDCSRMCVKMDLSLGLRSMGFVVCLVLGAVLAKAENGKMNGAGISSGGAEFG